MMLQVKNARKLANIAIVFALFVVMLGAFTRLTDAGLGCPDWPGCYGKMVLPDKGHAKTVAQALYPNIPIEPQKAWTEMAHRYAAGTLGLLMLVIVAIGTFGPNTLRLPKKLSIGLVALLAFQALLGMWTVTLQLLPVVVMGHLLGGMTIASLLVLIRLHWSDMPCVRLAQYKRFAYFGLFMIVLQIALGGWVSANYAGLACIGFPSCNQHMWPKLDMIRAFNVLSPIGANYQGGLLDLTARVTIQWVHRIWAVVTLLYIAGLMGWSLIKLPHNTLRIIAGLVFSLVCVQFVLGILNVVLMLPLPVAVLHNGVALLLLLSMICFCYGVSRRVK